MKISATLITFNEERNVAHALKSLDFVDEIVVVDSGSSDETVKIAQQQGAKVHYNSFINYGNQKNFAASLAQNDWILNIDSDEEVSLELKKAIQKLKENPSIDLTAIYRVDRITNFCGKWIKHGGWYPDLIPRFYNKKFAKWSEPPVHEKLQLINPSNTVKNLHGHLYHYSFPTYESQILTNFRYAKQGSKNLKKSNFFAIILKPIGKFFECYLFKKGFLDGRFGLIIAINAAYSIFMKYLFAYPNSNDEKIS